MRVDVSGHQFVFPPQCACCGETANSTWTVSASRSRGTRVIHKTTRCWDFPYCDGCVHHASIYDSAARKSLWVFVVAFFLAMVLHSAWSLIPLTVGVVLSIVLFDKTRKEAEAARSSSCVFAGPTVSYLGFHATVNSFDFAGPYAWAFASANANKLVNESQEMRQYVDAIAPQRRSKNVHRPRRFES